MTVLIIIDLINGFCRPGYPLSLGVSAEGMEDYLRGRIEEVRRGGGRTVFVCDSHSDGDPEIGKPYPPHCLGGSAEAAIVESLAPYAAHEHVITKTTLSVFFGTSLDRMLDTWRPDTVEVAGVCTEICVLFAVYELRIRGYNVRVASAGVLPFNPAQQDMFLRYLSLRLGAEVS